MWLEIQRGEINELPLRYNYLNTTNDISLHLNFITIVCGKNFHLSGKYVNPIPPSDPLQGDSCFFHTYLQEYGKRGP